MSSTVRGGACTFMGVEAKENEDEDGIMNVLEDRYSSVNLQFDANNIDRVYRVGLP